MKITLRNPRKSSAYIFRIIYHYYKSPKFSKYFTRHPTGHHPMKRTTRPRPVFVNTLTPDLFTMAKRAGHTIKDGGKTEARTPAVILDGKKMSATQARAMLLLEHDYYTFNNQPCQV